MTPHNNPTFDDILPLLTDIFENHRESLKELGKILINRDLNGRVRLILDEKHENSQIGITLANEIANKLNPHTFPAEHILLFEQDFEEVLKNEVKFALEGFIDIFVVDRLATESNWSTIKPLSDTCPRVVFYSIKGGVGRSTALAVVAWAMAEQGKKVLVLDLDLESPGLSSVLLSEDRRPKYGVTDWLVEDLVGNGNTTFQDMVASSNLSQKGDIRVVPAHGADPGEYIAKLGRVWMPKIDADGNRKNWY